MNSISQEIDLLLEQLTQAPLRLQTMTSAVTMDRLHLRSEAEPWSVNDILAHLRACADLWGASIATMLTRDNPTLRYVSPRSLMKKPRYAEQEFKSALASFAQERQKLVEQLSKLDAAGWARGATFTGTSAQQREQTVLRYANRIVGHEQPHLEQIESLLR